MTRAEFEQEIIKVLSKRGIKMKSSITKVIKMKSVTITEKDVYPNGIPEIPEGYVLGEFKMVSGSDVVMDTQGKPFIPTGIYPGTVRWTLKKKVEPIFRLAHYGIPALEHWICYEGSMQKYARVCQYETVNLSMPCFICINENEL